MRMPFPVNVVKSPYGVRDRGGFEWHNGIDLSIKSGKINFKDDTKEPDIKVPIQAVLGGKIVQQNLDTKFGKGNNIEIKAIDGTNHYYFHLYSFSKNKNDDVQEGDILGIMGTTGESSGVHLHFEVRKSPFVRTPEKDNKGNPSVANSSSVNAAEYLGIENKIGAVKKDDGGSPSDDGPPSDDGASRSEIKEEDWNSAVANNQKAQQTKNEAASNRETAKNKAENQRKICDAYKNEREAAQKRLNNLYTKMNEMEGEATSKLSGINQTIETVFNGIQNEINQHASEIFGV